MSHKPKNLRDDEQKGYASKSKHFEISPGFLTEIESNVKIQYSGQREKYDPCDIEFFPLL
jgi:hypothetical protein